MTGLYVSISVLVGVLLAIYVITMWRTWGWKSPEERKTLKGLALPDGSVRSLIAFLIVGAFVIFIFFGKDAVSPCQTDENQLEDSGAEITTEDDSLYNTILASFATLTGAVTGFYFGNRGSKVVGESGTSDSPRSD